MRGYNGHNRRGTSYFPYIIGAVVLYVVYILVSSAFKRSPSVPLNMSAGPGGVPIIDLDGAPAGFQAVLPVSQVHSHRKAVAPEDLPDTNPSSLSDQQRTLLKSMLPNLQRIVHLDFKGAAPKVLYIRRLFPLLKQLGATGLLIEWEDMFPYDGKLANLSAENAYTKDEVQEILSLAKNQNFLVIPLVQMFGHMEFVLKNRQYKHLREDFQLPQVINPLKEESHLLLQEIITQQLALQPNVGHLHIGCDEVWALGSSQESKNQMEELGVTKDDIFLNHVNEVAGYIITAYPKVEVIMWDDMFRKVDLVKIQRARLSTLVTPMVWMYTNCVDCKIPPLVWAKYGKLFSSVWIASAFKGATGSNQYITDISYHYANHMSWLSLISSDYAGALNIQGTVLTGWQRYDHFATLCELLPVGIPSLAVNLAALQHAGVNKVRLQQVNDALGCLSDFPIQWNINKNNSPPPKCTFPGHEVLEAAYEVKNAQHFIGYLDAAQSMSGWHTDYNMKRYFTSPWKMKYMVSKCDEAMKHLKLAEATMNKYLMGLFSEETLVEWLETYIHPEKNLLRLIKQQAVNALQHDSWPRRPIHKHSHINGTKVKLNEIN